MSVVALYDTDVTLLVGSIWDIGATVLDADGLPVAFAPPVTITPPSGPPAVLYPTDPSGIGQWRITYAITVPGRHVAVMLSSFGVLAFTAYGTEPVTAPLMPSLADLRGASPARDDPADLGYLGGNSWTDAEIQEALDAEAAAQRDICRIPADYPASLRESLLRRVSRNLAMRHLPLAVLQGDGETGDATRLTRWDPEIRRLEQPYRKLPLA